MAPAMPILGNPEDDFVETFEPPGVACSRAPRGKHGMAVNKCHLLFLQNNSAKDAQQGDNTCLLAQKIKPQQPLRFLLATNKANNNINGGFIFVICAVRPTSQEIAAAITAHK